jgi:hypothetical protein
VNDVTERGRAMDDHTYEDIAKLAYRFWEERGRPQGSPGVDWYRAEREWEIRRQDLPVLLELAFEPGWSGDGRR